MFFLFFCFKHGKTGVIYSYKGFLSNNHTHGGYAIFNIILVLYSVFISFI